MKTFLRTLLAAWAVLIAVTGCKTAGDPPLQATTSGDLLLAGSCPPNAIDIQAGILLQTVWTRGSVYGDYTVKESLEVFNLPPFRLAGGKTVVRSGELELSLSPAGGAPSYPACPGGILVDVTLTGRVSHHQVHANANALCVRTNLPPGFLPSELSRTGPYPLPESIVRLRGQLQSQQVGIVPVRAD